MEHLIPALAARRYYVDGRTKTEIANELGLSRFKVARILDQAMRDGIVHVHIETPPELDLDLSDQVAARLGLRQVLVVHTPEDPALMRRQLGKACAALLVQRLSADDVLGVSWGRTLHALTDVVPHLPRAEVVQMVGGIPAVDLSVNAIELLRRLGERTGGPVHALYVPMIMESAEVAASVRATRHVAATLSACSRITCALVGIGTWRPGESSLREALPEFLARTLDAAGAVADVCSTVVDVEGMPVTRRGLLDRCVSVTAEQLHAIPDVIALAGGAAKAEAITAAARGRLVDRLITDTTAATALLALD